MIQLTNLSKSYNQGRVQAVSGLELDIPTGEIVGFLGPNGAGKTTTINMMVGLLLPDEGSITVDGIDILERPLEAKSRIGFVPDNPNLYDKLTGVEYIGFMADVFGVPEADRLERTETLMELFEMESNLADPIDSYSHGMRQKIALMGALVHDPWALVMDEPMSGLDPKSSFRFKELLRERCDAGKLVFLSTHVLDVAERICDRVAIIDDGRLVAEGTMEELREQAGQSQSLERFFLDITERS
jgi:ABC-2 type transport system ATP-binding protein